MLWSTGAFISIDLLVLEKINEFVKYVFLFKIRTINGAFQQLRRLARFINTGSAPSAGRPLRRIRM